jgi:hypothetical protein
LQVETGTIALKARKLLFKAISLRVETETIAQLFAEFALKTRNSLFYNDNNRGMPSPIHRARSST